MPAEVPLPIELDQLPLAARTSIRDVRLVSIEAQAPDVPIEGTAVHFAMGDMAYRVEGDTLFSRVVATARYLDGETGTSDPAANGAEPTSHEVGRIALVLLAELAFKGGAISETQADEFMTRNLIFTMFPYLRTYVQQFSTELRLPLTVLPDLPRGTEGISDDTGAQN